MDPDLYQKATASAQIDHSLDGESRTTYIVSILTVACVLSTAAVIARIYTRLYVLHTFGRDDFVMGLAQVLTLMTAAAIFLGKPSQLCDISTSDRNLTYLDTCRDVLWPRQAYLAHDRHLCVLYEVFLRQHYPFQRWNLHCQVVYTVSI